MRCTSLHVLIAILALCVCDCGEKNPERYSAYHYNDEVKDVNLTSLEAPLAKAVREAMRTGGRPVADLDHLLVAAARNHSLLLLEGKGNSLDSIESEQVQQTLLEVGCTDSNFSVQVIRAATIGRIENALRDLVKKGLAEEDYTHFGVGCVHRTFPLLKAATVIFTKRYVDLDIFPRFLPEAGETWLKGVVLPRAEEPTVFLTTPSGEILEVMPRVDAGGEFRVRLPFDNKKAGRYMVEVEVNSRDGPQIAALFPVDFLRRSIEGRPFLRVSGAAGKDSAGESSSIKPPMTEAEAEQFLARLINEERKKRRFIPLIEDPELAEMARSHSMDMRDNSFVSHLSPSTGDAAKRADKMGIEFARLTENVATNTDITALHRSLMDSPAHRRNILDPKVYYMGVGVAKSDGKRGAIQYYVTVNFLDKR